MQNLRVVVICCCCRSQHTFHSSRWQCIANTPVDCIRIKLGHVHNQWSRRWYGDDVCVAAVTIRLQPGAKRQFRHVGVHVDAVEHGSSWASVSKTTSSSNSVFLWRSSCAYASQLNRLRQLRSSAACSRLSVSQSVERRPCGSIELRCTRTA